MERLRRHGVISLLDMERLLVLLEKKGKDNALINILEKAEESKIRVATLEDLKSVLDIGVYNRVCKGLIEWKIRKEVGRDMIEKKGYKWRKNA